MRDFKKLDIWVKSYELTLSIYKLTNKYPKSEIFGLTSQIRRAASSIPANIAEGCGRNSDADFKRFLYISFASANELETYITLSKDLNLISQDDFLEIDEKVIVVRKMIYSMIGHLN